MTPDALDPAKLAELRADAENPLIAPSRRVAARTALRALGEGVKRREPIEPADGLLVLRVLVREMGDG
ncbi:hypothetical protein [Acidiphilium acidophilum]|uniref:Uncharacterized protein n=1 Tax=Acidiphilium acidophilum TaxID=76588 RepID=A0AAW9DP44_ACIAO|nr:hypothetical protein [Acidiphilium acidophilum]MDX5930495.1 hypothetical protein [Acidiphilium acidophilum]